MRPEPSSGGYVPLSGHVFAIVALLRDGERERERERREREREREERERRRESTT